MSGVRAAAITERQLTDAVVSLATLLGYLIHHDRPGRTTNSWRTAVQGTAGFPDLVLAHPSTKRVLYVELKTGNGKLSPWQVPWVDTLDAAVWRPSDLLDGTIERILIEGAGR